MVMYVHKDMFVSLSRIKILFLSLVFLCFPISHLKWTFFSVPIYFSELFFFLALFCVLIETARNTRNLFVLRPRRNTKITILLVFFLLGASISYLFNEPSLTGLGMLKSFFFLPVLFGILLYELQISQKNREMILWLWLAGVTVLAWGSLIIALNGGFTYDGRLAGLYESPNYLAMLLAPGALLSIYFFSHLPQNILKFGALFFFVVIMASLFLTQSYGAIMSSLISFSLFMVLLRKQMKYSIRKVSIFIGAVFVLFVSFSLTTHKAQTLLFDDQRSSFVSRQMIWQSAWKIGMDHPYIGIGVGNFQTKYLEYQTHFPPYLEWAVPQPHNLYLALWLQSGLFGLGSFCFFVGNVFLRWITVWKQNNLSESERLFGALLLVLIVFYLVYGFVDTPYFKNDLAFAWWGLTGVTLSWINEILSRKEFQSSSR